MQYDNHIIRYHAYWLAMALSGRPMIDDWCAT